MRKFYLLEFIMAAHVSFCILIEMQSVIFPKQPTLAELDNPSPIKKNTHANHNSYFDLFGFFGLCVWLGLKYFVEGFRFNSILIMAAYTFFFFDRALQFADKILCQVGALLTIIYIWTLVSYPVYEFPKPTGKFRTCFKTIKLNDSYSTDASVYYPCADNKQDDITYKWLPHNKFAKMLYELTVLQEKWVPSEWMFDVGCSFLNFITFKASPEMPLLEKEHNVVIFSHGFSQHRNAYTAICQQLASEGNVVFSLQHLEMVYPWDTKSTKIYNTGNYPEVLEKYQRIRAAHLDWRFEQVACLVQTLQKGKIGEVFFDFKPLSINLVGHSFGGATVLRVAQEMKVNSAIAYDPWLFPFTPEQMRKQVQGRTLVIHKDRIRKKIEAFDPKLLKDFLEFNTTITNLQIKGLDHAYPCDLTYLIGAEMVLVGELRNDDRIFEINSLLASTTSKFMQNKILGEDKNIILN